MRQFDLYMETIIRHQREATARHVQRQSVIRALAHPVRLRRMRFYQPALVIVGKRLVIWGMRLQRLYPETIPAAEVTLVTQNK